MADNQNEDLEIEIADDLETDAPVTVDEPAVEPKKELSAEDGIAELKAAREAKAEAERDAREARKAYKEVEERLAESNRTAQSRQSQDIDGHINQLTTAKATINAEVQVLRRDYAEAARTGDYDKQADLQIQIAEKAAAFHQYTSAIANLNERKKAPVQVEQRAASKPTESPLSSKAQAWVDAHRDIIADPVMYKKMRAGHYDAEAEGIEIDSPEYFEHVEKRMGLKKDEPASAPPRKVQTAAPASKSAPSAAPNRVTLTSAEMALCRDIGQDPKVYAKNKLMLQRQGALSSKH